MSDFKDIKKGFQGIAIILSFILACIILFYAGKLAYKEIFRKNIKIEEIQDHLSAEVKMINTIIKSIQSTPQDLAYILEFHDIDKNEIKILLESVLFNNEELYGSAIAFEPYKFRKDSLYNSFYVYKKNDSIIFTDLNGPKYNYFYKDWYIIPRTLNKPVWSEPYYDDGGGNQIMSTYSVPFYKFNKNKELFHGIVTVDVSVEWLTKAVQSMGEILYGYPMLISENGTIISAPEKNSIFHETIFTIAAERKLPVLREIGRDLQKGKSGYKILYNYENNEDWYVFYSPVESNKWGLLILLPESKFFRK